MAGRQSNAEARRRTEARQKVGGPQAQAGGQKADETEAPEPRNRPNDRGHLRFDRRFPTLGVPRLQRSSGTSKPSEFATRNGYLTKLAALGCGEELRAFASGEIGIEDIVRAFEEHDVRGFLEKLRASRGVARVDEAPSLAIAAPTPTAPVMHSLAAAIWHGLPTGDPNADKLAAPLWSTALDVVIPSMDKLEPDSRRRYMTSIRGLQRKLTFFAADDDAFQTLADISGQHWEAIDLARMRGVRVTRLEDYVLFSPEHRRLALKVARVRLGEDVFTTLATLPKRAWRAMAKTGESLPDLELVQALDRLSNEDREALRAAARKLGPDSSVGDLGLLTEADWKRLSQAWGGSDADWNHMRRALSAVLTKHFGTSDAPFRRAVIRAIPLKAEEGRTPDLTPELLWRVVEALPAEAACFPIVLVLTGARIGEYERLERKHLLPNTHVVKIPGTKTRGSKRDVHIAPDFWHYIDAAVPAPREYGWLRRTWKQACAAAGIEGVTLHDLRHCHGQWAVKAGAQEQSVQTTLGHTSPNQTRVYTKTLQKGEVAHALRSALGESQPR